MRLTLGAFLILLAFPSMAEVIRVRSGEHSGFSRLVFDLPRGADWELGRAGEDYLLRLTPTHQVDAGTIFRLIPRSRLRNAASEEDGSLIRLTVAPETRARPFMTSDGALVIDIADGAPDPASPYERPLLDLVEPTPHSAASLQEPVVVQPFWPGVVAGLGMPPAVLQGQIGNPDGSALPSASALPPHPMTPEPSEKPTALASASLLGAEARLMQELGRAASEGVVAFAPEIRPPASASADAQPVGDLPRPVEPDPAPAPAPLQPDVPMAMETALDRALRERIGVAGPRDREGRVCPADSQFDLASWGDGRPFDLQMAEANGDLLGEFDRPDPNKLLRLARLELHFGLGAEVLALFRAYPDIADPVLADMARLIEGQELSADSPLRDRQGCAGTVALWSVLGSAETNGLIDEEAVRRSYSALPPDLRRYLGPGLVEKLLVSGRVSAARSIRDALGRIDAAGAPALTEADARLELALGRPEAALPKLADLAESPADSAARAVILRVHALLGQSTPVPPDLAQTAIALAAENRPGPLGADLARAAALAAGSQGDFGAAFDLAAPSVQPEIWAELAQTPSDETFLSQVLQRLQDIEQQDLSDLLRHDLANRLLASGLPEPAAAVLAGATRADDQLLAARIALARGDANTAVNVLDGIDTAAAKGLRAQAYEARGDHAAAETLYRDLGLAEQASAAAWRAGALDQLGQGTGARDVVAALSEPVPLAAQPSLTEARSLLQNSQQARDAWTQLLQPDR